MGGRGAEALVGIEVCVGTVQDVAGRVVDVKQDRVIGSSRRSGIESRGAHHGAEEVRTHECDPAVGGQTCGVRKQIPFMPVDDRLGVLDHGQRRNPVADQRFSGGVAQAEAADHHIQVRSWRSGQTEAGQFPFGDGEEARHHVLVIEFDLIDVGTHGQVIAAPQADQTHRRLLPTQFLEAPAHRRNVSPALR